MGPYYYGQLSGDALEDAQESYSTYEPEYSTSPETPKFVLTDVSTWQWYAWAIAFGSLALIGVGIWQLGRKKSKK